jgi:hypothetical protein
LKDFRSLFIVFSGFSWGRWLLCPASCCPKVPTPLKWQFVFFPHCKPGKADAGDTDASSATLLAGVLAVIGVGAMMPGDPFVYFDGNEHHA